MPRETIRKSPGEERVARRTKRRAKKEPLDPAAVQEALTSLARETEEELEELGVLGLIREYPVTAIGVGVGLGLLLGRGGDERTLGGRMSGKLREVIVGAGSAYFLRQAQERFHFDEEDLEQTLRSALKVVRKGRSFLRARMEHS